MAPEWARYGLLAGAAMRAMQRSGTMAGVRRGSLRLGEPIWVVGWRGLWWRIPFLAAAIAGVVLLGSLWGWSGAITVVAVTILWVVWLLAKHFRGRFAKRTGNAA